mmetsp:Transcript_12591/g.21879  ORF Transcript_12591/g.21879 Transcript_12591/m.21879 type:complete len:310 (+) Transcript_12591:110-1039(+)
MAHRNWIPSAPCRTRRQAQQESLKCSDRTAIPKMDSICSISQASTTSPPDHWDSSFSEGTDTYVFVDVDGVLNVKVSSGEYVNKENIDLLDKMKEANAEALQGDAAKRLLAACSCSMEGDSKTYAEVCKDATSLVGLFVERLARIIEAAGSSANIVLSSTWRRPKFANKLRELEGAISECLGSPFTFEYRTGPMEDRTGGERVWDIAEYLAEHCTHKSVKVLVLDDFNCSSLNWSCNGQVVTSVEDVETFLAGCLPTETESSVKLVHTYDEWRLSDGMLMQLGSGITHKQFDIAMRFLCGDDGWSIASL